jgi:hypothetical protein
LFRLNEQVKRNLYRWVGAPACGGGGCSARGRATSGGAEAGASVPGVGEVPLGLDYEPGS